MIQINDKYAIKADNMSFKVATVGFDKGVKTFRTRWYFNKLDHTLDKILDLAVADGIDQGSWAAVLDEIQKVRIKIDEIIALFRSEGSRVGRSRLGE